MLYYRCWFRNTKKGSSRKSKFKCLFVILTLTKKNCKISFLQKYDYYFYYYYYLSLPLKRILINTHKFSFLCHKTNRKIFNKFSNVNISVLKYSLVLFLLAGKWKNESTATRRFKDFHNFKVSSRIYFTTIIICGSYFPSFFCSLSLFWL